MLHWVWELHGEFFYQLIHRLLVRVVKRRKANNHLVDQNADGPPVDCVVVPLVLDDLWSQVFRRPSEGACEIAVCHLFGKSEICEVQVTVFAHQNVFRLDVSVDDLLVVQVPDG